MANKAVEIKVLQDIEIKVIGNTFGLLIAVGGLLAGNMATQLSFEYWQEDIVLLVLLLIMGFRLTRSLIATFTAYQVVPYCPHPLASAADRESIHPEQAAYAQIAGPRNYTAEEVMDAVAKRIEQQKEEAVKKNKFTN